MRLKKDLGGPTTKVAGRLRVLHKVLKVYEARLDKASGFNEEKKVSDEILRVIKEMNNLEKLIREQIKEAEKRQALTPAEEKVGSKLEKVVEKYSQKDE